MKLFKDGQPIEGWSSQPKLGCAHIFIKVRCTKFSVIFAKISWPGFAEGSDVARITHATFDSVAQAIVPVQFTVVVFDQIVCGGVQPTIL